MKQPLRVIDTGQRSARWNVAMTAALAELHQAGRVGDTLRFHRYPRSVLIGRHQAPGLAADLRRCRADGVEIARRVTGGGAVYMAPGALAWDIVLARKPPCSGLDRAAAAIGAGLARGLSRLGIRARYRPPNDIAVDGKKLCGSSGYFDGPTLAYQGTILVDTDFQDMARYLRSPAGSRQDDVGLVVTTLAQALGRVPALSEIAGAISLGIAEALGRDVRQEQPAPEELLLADALHRREFGTDWYVGGADDPAAFRHAASVPLAAAQP
jgi:lipoate-protein ligase A